MKSNDSLSVGFRLKAFFNYYIKNTKGNSMAKVKTLQDMFREYYEQILRAEISAEKLIKVKRNIRKH